MTTGNYRNIFADLARPDMETYLIGNPNRPLIREFRRKGTISFPITCYGNRIVPYQPFEGQAFVPYHLIQERLPHLFSIKLIFPLPRFGVGFQGRKDERF